MMPWGAGSLRWLNTVVGFSLPLCSCFSWVGVHALGHWDSEEDKSGERIIWRGQQQANRKHGVMISSQEKAEEF